MMFSGLEERHLRLGHQRRFQISARPQIQKSQVNSLLQLLRNLQWKGILEFRNSELIERLYIIVQA
jgi:hypothetical protein